MPPTSINANPAFIYGIAAVGALGGLLFGYDTGVIAGALLFVREQFHAGIIMQQVIVSSVVLGALVGALLSGRLADRFGRRVMLMAAAVAFILSTLFSSLADQLSVLILGRFVTGLAIGISSYTAPLFISEMAPAAFRGRLVLINAVTITGGEALAFLVDYWLTPTHAWRWMFAAGLIPAVALWFGMWKLPETPRWLVSKGHSEKAQQILLQTRSLVEMEQELRAIQQSFSLQSYQSWRQLFSKKIRPVLWIGLILGIFQQFFGINTVMYYGPTIFQALGLQGAEAQMLATLGMGVVNTVFSLICLLLIDRLGRRKLLLIGSATAAVSLLVVGGIMGVAHPSVLLQWIALSSLVIYIAGYCVSVGSLFWLIIAEIFPLSIRGLGMSMATAVQWGANFVVSMTFLTLITAIGARHTFWLYAGVCAMCVLYCYLKVPETRGISLEQIEENLDHQKPSRQLGVPLETSV